VRTDGEFLRRGDGQHTDLLVVLGNIAPVVREEIVVR
jgi:hypothetical protein